MCFQSLAPAFTPLVHYSRGRQQPRTSFGKWLRHLHSFVLGFVALPAAVHLLFGRSAPNSEPHTHDSRFALSYVFGSPLALPRPCSRCGSLRTFRKFSALRLSIYSTHTQSGFAFPLCGRLVATRIALTSAVRLASASLTYSGNLDRFAFLGFSSFGKQRPSVYMPRLLWNFGCSQFQFARDSHSESVLPPF